MKKVIMLLSCILFFAVSEGNAQQSKPEKGSVKWNRRYSPTTIPPPVAAEYKNSVVGEMHTAEPVAEESKSEIPDPNPAHGQPNHRCDIPVGASLSKSPAYTPAE